MCGVESLIKMCIVCQSEKKVQLEARVVILSIVAGALSRGVGVTPSNSGATLS